MDMTELRYFITTADLGNYSAAASYLLVSRQAVTKGIKKIETEIGRPLFETDGRQLVLTSEGAALLADARPIVDSYMELCYTHLSRTPLPGNRLKETLHVHVTEGWDIAPIENPIALFQTNYPNATPYIADGNASGVIRAVASKHADVGILQTHPSLITEFESIRLYGTTFYMWMPENHALASRTTITPADLSGHSMLTLANSNHGYAYLSSQCRKLGFSIPSAGEAGTLDLLIEMATATGLMRLGISPNLVELPPHTVAIPLDVPGMENCGAYAIRKHSSALTPAARNFWKILQDISAEHGDCMY